MSHRTAAGRLVAALLAVSLAAAGCAAGVQSLSFGPPRTTLPQAAPPVTFAAGLAAVPETPVPGATTTTAPAIGPGTASLTGTVTGPGGTPVAGATVEVDRVVGYVYESMRATTGTDGTWSVRNVLGGDYRVRAWRAPALDMATPQLLFVAAGHPQSLTLQLTSYAGQQVQVAINPGTPTVSQPATLVVEVANPSVDGNGVLTEPPVPGAEVTLVNGPNWEVLDGNPQPTNSAGDATFAVQCTTAGANPLSAQVGTQPPVAMEMPTCLPGVSPPSTAPSSGSSTTTCTTVTPPADPSATTTSLAFGGC